MKKILKFTKKVEQTILSVPMKLESVVKRAEQHPIMLPEP